MAEPQNHVWLNDVRLPIRGPILWNRVTPFPAQFSTAAPVEADYTPVRKQRWGNLKGGAGKEKWSPQDNDRYWYAEGVDASQEAQVLAPLVTTLDGFGAAPVKLIKYGDRIWAIGHNKISYWTGSAWTPVRTDFPNPTDAIIFYGASA